MDRQEDALRRLGRRLAQLREKRQLTIDVLAGLAGLDPALLAGIEAGDVDVQLTALVLLARALGITSGQLIEDI